LVLSFGFVKGESQQKRVGSVPKMRLRASRGAGRPSLGYVGRRPRNLYQGIYHLAARGSDTRHLFLRDEDREEFLERLAAIWAHFELALLSYVLMGSHYHALVRIPDARLSQALQHLHTEYSRWHNRRHGRSAHLFRAHALTRKITSDRQLVAASRYLALNPVAAGLVPGPLDWPWSSARAHAGLQRPRIPLAESDLRAAFGGTDDWRERYRSTIHEPEDEDTRA
jgi:putative transposase